MRMIVFAAALSVAAPAAAQTAKPTAQPTARALKPAPSGDNNAEIAKMKPANEAKEKALDARMKRIMTGICRGC